MNKVEELQARVAARFKDAVCCSLQQDQLTVEIAAADLLHVCHALKNELDFQFEQLMDICGVDYLHYGIGDWATNTSTAEGFSRGVEQDVANNTTREQRFALVYHLLSLTRNHRIRLRVYAHGEPPRVPTLTNIWRSADWYEREAFDLFGIIFEGHPDLRRILCDYGFIGHPFRKDFPLIGQVEMRYDASAGRVIYEPVSIQPRTLVPKVVRKEQA